MLIAQLSDLHIRPEGQIFADVVDTMAMLRAAIDAVLALDTRPDVVLISGDLANDGEPEAYDAIRPELSRLPMPIYAVPGNHDDREAMTALADLAEMGRDKAFRQFTVDLGGLQLIGLDSFVPSKASGEICADRLGWLEQALTDSEDRPVLLMVHHPPGQTGIGFMDRIPLRTSLELEELIARNSSRIARILCGHVHRPIHYHWQGVPVSIAPGTAHHVKLVLDDGEPAFVMEPPGFHLHRWTAQTGLVTHQVPIGNWPGPYRFSGNPGGQPIS